MARKKKKNTRKFSALREEFNNEIYGIFTIAFGLILLTALQSNSAGKIGEGFKFFLMGLFANMALILPYMVILIGILVFINKPLWKQLREVFYLLLIFIYSLITKSLLDFWTDPVFVEKLFQDGLFKSINTLFLNGTKGVGGGVIGSSIAYILVKLFGKIGSYIIIITLFLVSTIMYTKISLVDISVNCKNYIIKLAALLKKLFLGFKSNFINKTNDLDINVDKKPENKSMEDHTLLKKDAIVDEKIKILDYTGINNNHVPYIENNDDIKENKNVKTMLEDKNKENEVLCLDTNNYNINDEFKYELPNLELLNEIKHLPNKDDKKKIVSRAKTLEETLENFGVDAKVLQVTKGPSVTRYELQPSTGVKVSRIVNLSDDIALNLAAVSIRIEAPIPGKAAIGIEIPNDNVSIVTLKEIIESDNYQSFKFNLPFALGKDVAGNPIVGDISKMPHLLIAGATGSGKSVCINTLILSLLYKSTPETVRLILIDPKVVELNQYNGIPHLLIPVVNDAKKATSALNWAVQEMTQRYKLFGENNVKDITGYNEKIETNKLPHIVIIIDELADLMMVAANEVEDAICRLAQMARASGIHLIIATQRPSVDVITGVIKANIPSRIAFSVAAQTDSRTILDMGGAEKLLGKGDMLFYPMGSSKPTRIQGAFVSEKEVERVVNYIKNQIEQPSYVPEIIEKIDQNNISGEYDNSDEFFDDALKLIVENQQASISMLQRRLRIGYNRAARIIDEMEDKGIIGPHEGSKPRQVLIDQETLNGEEIS